MLNVSLLLLARFPRRPSKALERTGVACYAHGTYHPRLLRLLSDAVKVSRRPPEAGGPPPRLTIRLPGKPSSKPASPQKQSPEKGAKVIKPPSTSARKPTARMSASGSQPKPPPAPTFMAVEEEYDELDPSGSDDEYTGAPEGGGSASRRQGKKTAAEKDGFGLDPMEITRRREACENRNLFLAWDDEAEVRARFLFLSRFFRH